MAFYPKRLRNIDDLKREKQFLLEERKRLDNEDFLSIDGILSSVKKEDSGGIDFSSLLSFLPIGNPLVSSVINLLKERIFKRSAEPRQAGSTKEGGKKKDKNVLKSLAFEVMGGYLKWKAIELSYKGVRHLIRKRKEKRQAK